MKKFIVIYHAPADLVKSTGDKTPEEMRAAMKPWMEWAQKCGDKLVDIGQPLTGGQKLNADGACAIEVHETMLLPGNDQ